MGTEGAPVLATGQHTTAREVLVPAGSAPEIEQDLEFERRAWIIERVGWILMLLVVIAALLGLFGHGVLGYRSATAPNGSVTVEYEAVARKGGSTGLDISVRAPRHADAVVVLIADSYLRHVDVESITPEPSVVTGSGDAVRFEFPVAPGTDELLVRLQLRPDALGSIEGSVETPDGPPVRFSQFVLP